jgi:hypothetical protein
MLTHHHVLITFTKSKSKSSSLAVIQASYLILCQKFSHAKKAFIKQEVVIPSFGFRGKILVSYTIVQVCHSIKRLIGSIEN